ncbi:MAG: hypothetical protein LC105_06130 [Chitinophagales bacterium]|nr:hypothetical protein [Chitinophagales bacterium]
MKTFSKEELNAIAQSVAQDYGADKVFVTSDGQVFLSLNRASLHIASKADECKLNVYEIARVEQSKENKVETAADKQAEKETPLKSESKSQPKSKTKKSKKS